MKKSDGDLGITLIGLFKLFKAIVLIAAAFGLHHLLHRDVESTVMRWVEWFRLDPDNHYIHRALVRIFRVTPAQLKALSAGTFLYAALFLTEGIGLLKRRHWAEYVTVVSTALFLPLEAFELRHRFTWIRLAVLVINMAIVWYLAARIKRRRF
ncbi:MAG: DUF2127 domain-containing protein [Acidobacteriota bacterium]